MTTWWEVLIIRSQDSKAPFWSERHRGLHPQITDINGSSTITSITGSFHWSWPNSFWFCSSQKKPSYRQEGSMREHRSCTGCWRAFSVRSTTKGWENSQFPLHFFWINSCTGVGHMHANVVNERLLRLSGTNVTRKKWGICQYQQTNCVFYTSVHNWWLIATRLAAVAASTLGIPDVRLQTPIAFKVLTPVSAKD